MIKPTQGAAFKKLWDHLVVFMEAQDPGQGNPKKVCEDKVSKHGHKDKSDTAPFHK